MGERLHHSGSSSGFQNRDTNNLQRRQETRDEVVKSREDKDLIIEENTVYEIDRECYERLKRQRKRKVQDNKKI